MNGFGHVWVFRSVGNVPQFLDLFKQRLIDCYTQQWHSKFCQVLILNVIDLLSQQLCWSPFYMTGHGIDV